MANANPDNFFDNNKGCWTSDPLCGLDFGPKRPWEDLREPEKALFKFQRNAVENQHLKADGYKSL